MYMYIKYLFNDVFITEQNYCILFFRFFLYLVDIFMLITNLQHFCLVRTWFGSYRHLKIARYTDKVCALC